MKGLIYKDYLLIKKSVGRIVALLFCLYFIVGFINGNFTFMSSMQSVLCMVCVMNTFSYDIYTGWDKYAVTAIKARRDVVFAKYLFMLAVSAAMLAITLSLILITCALKNTAPVDNIVGTLSSAVVSIILSSVTIPIIIKFGLDKARLMIVLVAIVSAILIYTSAKIIPIDTASQLGAGLSVGSLSAAAIISVAAVLAVSVLLSIKFYEAKEL